MNTRHETGGSISPFGVDGGTDDDEVARARATERRARFTRYVRWMVGAGVARRFVVDPAAMADEPPHASSAFTVAAQPPLSPSAVAPSEPTPAPSAVAAKAPARDPKEAKREKKAAQRALDHRKLDDAIAAGTHSVALDPTDAEAWLVLGAAYLEKHDTASAQSAFTSCAKSATRGPKKECASLLR
jgi:hypothetical protein